MSNEGTHICNRAEKACADCPHAVRHYPMATDGDEAAPCTQWDECCWPMPTDDDVPIKVRCERIKEGKAS